MLMGRIYTVPSLAPGCPSCHRVALGTGGPSMLASVRQPRPLLQHHGWWPPVSCLPSSLLSLKVFPVLLAATSDLERPLRSSQFCFWGDTGSPSSRREAKPPREMVPWPHHPSIYAMNSHWGLLGVRRWVGSRREPGARALPLWTCGTGTANTRSNHRLRGQGWD